MNRNRFMFNSLVFVMLIGWNGAYAAKPHDPKIWEKDIQAFEKQDQTQQTTPGGILFVGSSSIRMWDVKKYFPDLPVFNRGFGGSHLEDSAFYADRIVFPYQPAIIVLYAGDNDINDEKTPQRVSEDFKQFVEKVRAKLPETRIIYIAIKPSIKRWALIEPIRETNHRIQELCAKGKNMAFLDVDKPMIGEDGKPRKELFMDDGLHLNGKGYELWTALLRPMLKAPVEK